MARIYEETITVRLSTALKDNDPDPKISFLSDDAKDTLAKALEGLVDDPAVVIEL
jgi:hypothetical protein